MSRQIIILDDSDGSSSSDSIPSPSPFSPPYRRLRQERNEAEPSEAKRQRVSVLEDVKRPKDDVEEELLSEPTEQENASGGEAEPLSLSSKVLECESVTIGGEIVKTDEEKKESEQSLEDPDKMSVLEEAGESEASTAMAPRTSRTDRKPPAKRTSPPPPAGEPKATDPKSIINENIKDEIVSDYVILDEIPENPKPLAPLSKNELAALKLALLGSDDTWPSEWDGSSNLLTIQVPNPLLESKSGKNGLEQSLFEWANEEPQTIVFAHALLRHLYNQDSTPSTAKRMIAHIHDQSLRNSGYDMEPLVKRLLLDPAVLREDGWTTKQSAEPVGATGGPVHIGQKVFWEKYEGVVIAYIHDSDIGDLWKAMWLDGNETFDLEAEELQRAKKAWGRKFKLKEQPLPSARFASAAKFTVEGIEYGIIMAKSYDSRARHSLFWPARVMHVSEYSPSQSQSRRSSNKQKLQVIFLAPYWNGLDSNISNLALADILSQGTSAFSSGPLFEIETIDVSEDTIQHYPYQGENGLNIDEFQALFKYTGLPKNAYPRFLDSHRLALALKTYAQQELQSDPTQSHAGTAALTDTHALANETAAFPTALLHLPFQYILSNLPHSTEKNLLTMGLDDHVEPTIQLKNIMQSMVPPACWGQEPSSPTNGTTPLNGRRITPALSAALASPAAKHQLGVGRSSGTSSDVVSVAKLEDVASERLLQMFSHISPSNTMAARLLDDLKYLLTRLDLEVVELQDIDISQWRSRLIVFVKLCLRIKGQGEDTICSEEFSAGINAKLMLSEWQRACEKIYRHASVVFSCSNFGNGVTYIMSDSRCNEHITSRGCVERPVRIPAALKGARLAGAETGRNIEFLLSVGDGYMTQAEMKVIGMAHCSSYLKRMRKKCLAIEPGVTGAALTENSDFEGGEDTRGSRGSYTAAVAGVAAAVKAVDMIVGGQCVNAFCATRPPGHHAGRELHPMGAISNGFCILNNAACAALYATTPVSERGPGLKRVCVIDIDVHHGNGTQNILCETYDPRFFYVSLHAGGALINGYEAQEEDEYRVSVGKSKRIEDGIFPGRCGDTSPHKGVMNIPLGARVNAQDVGTALVSIVRPAVNAFAPDLIIVSAGFDAHKHDPLGMGGLSAEDFGHITETICSMANKCCSGRVLSILEGGYGVPCCRPQKDLFLPTTIDSSPASAHDSSEDDQSAYVDSQSQSVSVLEAPMQCQPLLEPGAPVQLAAQPDLLDLGNEIPSDMDDQVPQTMHKTLNRCHAEGFVDCVRKHVAALATNNDRKNS